VIRALVATALAAVVLAGVGAPGAQAAAPVALVPVARFAEPVGVVAAPGDRTRLFVVERAGRIVVRRGRTQSTFADLTGRVQSSGYEQGLLGLAFAPDYATSGTFYIYYTTPPPAGATVRDGGSDIVVSELRRADADHADPASERVLLRIPHRLGQYENGGQLRFGPDGRLWIGTGDGGGERDEFGNAQRLDPATDDADRGADALLGKLLRIDPAPGDGCGGACTIPADNPGFAQREVWAYGLRNPWRFAFDPLGADLVIADVGESRFEELDDAPAPRLGRGVNFGWPFYEGTARVDGTAAPPAGCCEPPALVRAHGAAGGYDAIIGGVWVADPGLPALAGRYLYASLGYGAIRSVSIFAGHVSRDRDTGLSAPSITSFGEDGCGRVYVTTLGGVVYRLSQGEGGCDAVGVTLTRRASRVRSGRVRGTLTCAVACTARVRATLRSGGRIVGRTGTVAVRLPAGRRTALSLRMPATARAALRRGLARGRRATATIVAEARAPTGGTRRATTTLRILA
jgi:glucose/arabinose dehydrogenase